VGTYLEMTEQKPRINRYEPSHAFASCPDSFDRDVLLQAYASDPPSTTRTTRGAAPVRVRSLASLGLLRHECAHVSVEALLDAHYGEDVSRL
jgi:hypothetical protein